MAKARTDNKRAESDGAGNTLRGQKLRALREFFKKIIAYGPLLLFGPE